MIFLSSSQLIPAGSNIRTKGHGHILKTRRASVKRRQEIMVTNSAKQKPPTCLQPRDSIKRQTLSTGGGSCILDGVDAKPTFVIGSLYRSESNSGGQVGYASEIDIVAHTPADSKLVKQPRTARLRRSQHGCYSSVLTTVR